MRKASVDVAGDLVAGQPQAETGADQDGLDCAFVARIRVAPVRSGRP